MNTRKETDLLGEREIQENLYYGIHTQRAIENFNISGVRISEFPLFIRGLILTKKACAMANAELLVIPLEKAKMIQEACDHILDNLGDYIDCFPTDVFQGGAGTSVNMNANEVISNVALERNGHQKGDYRHLHPNDHVNKCQSTNDAYPTAFRVAIYSYMDEFIASVHHLILTLEEKSIEFKEVLKMGRTQLQDAVPMSLGDEIGGWANNLREEIRHLERSRDLILEVNLGATAIGTGLNSADGFKERAVNYLAELTGKQFRSSPDLIEATSDCGAYVMISGALKRTSVKLSKICNDLRLLSSGPRCGFNEINLPELQAGSSIMPAKVNPVIPEVVNQVCFKVIGNDVTISFAAEGGQLQLNVMEPVIAQCLFESIKLLTNATITLADKCVSGITANVEEAQNMVMSSVGLITFLNPYIGHDMGDKIGKEAIATGKTIQELVIEKELLSETELERILSKENLMHPRFRLQSDE
ncbi:MAG: aspartate ammonia-lyase [Flavobacteriales bacterium]|nr:aspartate ammonia-lyase [Flavobacteriales bacterium]